MYKTLTKILGIIAKILKIGRFIGKALLTRIWLITTRKRIFYLAVLYYIIIENTETFLNGNFQGIITHIGKTLLEADLAILKQTNIILSSPGPITTAQATLTLISASLTILLFIRAGKLVIKKINPTVGVILAYGVPILIYFLAIFAVSQRFPFTGVIELVTHLPEITNQTTTATNISKIIPS